MYESLSGHIKGGCIGVVTTNLSIKVQDGTGETTRYGKRGYGSVWSSKIWDQKIQNTEWRQRIFGFIIIKYKYFLYHNIYKKKSL